MTLATWLSMALGAWAVVLLPAGLLVGRVLRQGSAGVHTLLPTYPLPASACDDLRTAHHLKRRIGVGR